MAVTARTIAAQRRMRAELDATVDAATADLVTAWAVAWGEIVDEWAAAIADLIAIGAGGWPSAGQILRATRAQRALQVASDALDELARQSGVRILSDVSPLAVEAALWVERVAQTQLPDGVTVTFARVDEQTIAAIVQRATEQVTARHWPLAADATAAMKSSLIRGVAVGDHPERAAARMLARVQGRFNGGLWRARNIARTEMMDAHRAGANTFRTANDDVVKGWMWQCEFSRRTCPACLAKHGTVYPASEPGPLGHQSCRCTALPVTKTWRELGFDVPEPEPIPVIDGEDWLRRQPPAVQEQILGKRGRDQWLAGNWPKSDWAQLRHTPDWRDSYGVAPVPA